MFFALAKKLKRITTKFEVSMPSRFHDIAVQNQPFYTYFSSAILSVLEQKINFWKAGLHLFKTIFF